MHKTLKGENVYALEGDLHIEDVIAVTKYMIQLQAINKIEILEQTMRK